MFLESYPPDTGIFLYKTKNTRNAYEISEPRESNKRNKVNSSETCGANFRKITFHHYHDLLSSPTSTPRKQRKLTYLHSPRVFPRYKRNFPRQIPFSHSSTVYTIYSTPLPLFPTTDHIVLFRCYRERPGPRGGSDPLVPGPRVAVGGGARLQGVVQGHQRGHALEEAHRAQGPHGFGVAWTRREERMVSTIESYFYRTGK